MKGPNMLMQLRHPVGLWRSICQHRQFNLRCGDRINFAHIWERRA